MCVALVWWVRGDVNILRTQKPKENANLSELIFGIPEAGES